MKRTTDFQWAHLVCAQWIPEVFFRLPEVRRAEGRACTPAAGRHIQLTHMHTHAAIFLFCVFLFSQGREPIDILMTPLRRHTQTCIFCGQSCGVCVECSDSTCKKWFHITCGQRNEIFLEYTQKNNGADVIVSYCKEHGKRWAKRNTKSVVRTR